MHTLLSAVTETSPINRNTCVVDCHGDVSLGDPRSQTGWHKGQMCLMALEAGCAGSGPVSTVFLGHSRHRAPAGCSHGRDPAVPIPSTRVTGAIMALLPIGPPTPVACWKPRLTGLLRGQGFHVCTPAGCALNPAITPVVLLGHNDQSAVSSSVGRGRSSHRVLVREVSEPERLCPGQLPRAANGVISTNPRGPW